MTWGDEHHAPHTKHYQRNAQREGKHPLEYVIGAFFILTFIATAIAACYTARQWRAAVDTEKRSLRAYVYGKASIKHGIQNVSVGSDPDTGVILRNAGQTPAHDVKSQGVIGYGTYPLNAALFRYPTLSQEQSILYLPPGTENEIVVPLNFGSPLTQETYDRVSGNGPDKIIVYGKVTYKDIFGDAHEVHFCFAYHGVGPTILEAAICNDYNGEVY